MSLDLAEHHEDLAQLLLEKPGGVHVSDKLRLAVAGGVLWWAADA